MTAALAQRPVYPSPARAWWAVFVFYLAYTLSFVDRQILAFLVGPIRADLKLTDFQFSLIHGLAFVLFYSTMGIPIGRLADRRSRRGIIALGIAFWSVATMLCGLAGSYWQLFLARLGVGVGEASLSPAAVSMIADLFPKERRALAISFYSAGVQGGAAIANIFGGLVVGFAMSGGVARLPVFGELRPWQAAFVLVGLPGLVVAALALSLREPPRHEVSAQRQSFAAFIAHFNRSRLAYSALIVGSAFAAMASLGAFSWVPALYIRRYGWGPARIGPYFGLILLVFGTAGMLLGGWIAERMIARNRSAPYSKIMIVSLLAAIVPSALLVCVHDPYWTLGCLALMVVCLSTSPGLVQAAIQAITPNEMRAQMIAVYLLVVALIGGGLGSSSVAAVTDFCFHNDSAVGSSIAVVASVAVGIGALLLLLGLKAYGRSAAMLRDEERSGSY